MLLSSIWSRRNALLVGSGVALGALVTHAIMAGQLASLYGQIKPIRATDSAHPLINPLLVYEIPNGSGFQFDTQLQSAVQALIAKSKNTGAADDVSVYYRDLPRGGWIGINENIHYDPASLMKVAITIAYYRQTETVPAALGRTIIYTNDLDNALSTVALQTPSELVVGRGYTVEQLIEALVTRSDNGAKNALLSTLDPPILGEVYSDLGIENPESVTGNYVISAKSYSLFFRILYNSTYLSRTLSERILELLTRAEYRDGLVGGVPSGVKVAHKYGEHINTDVTGKPTEYELHDCGIVYRADDPYVLCVMTRGPKLEPLAALIRSISALVYRQTPK